MKRHGSAEISVLMPCYQPNPAWLRAAIQSLNAQSFRDWQLIMSLDGDDQATLSSAQIARDALNAEHELIVVQGQRRGITDTLNSGLAACNTRYTARFDADDLCRPNRLQEQWQLLEDNHELVGCGMQINAIDTEGNRLKSRHHHYPTNPTETLLVGACINTPIAHPVLMFRTQAVRMLSGYRQQRCMEDYDLMARLSRVGGLTNLPGVGLDYRIHFSQHSRKARPMRKELLEARWLFMQALGRKTPVAWLLASAPLILYALGPQGELRLRRYANQLWNTALDKSRENT